MARVDKESEVLLDFFVGTFGLAVGLWVIRCGKRVGDAEFLVERIYKSCSKLGPMIRYNLVWDSIKAEYLSVM